MAQPIDYSLDVQTPFQSALQGYQGGAAIRNDMQQQEQQRLTAQSQQQMQADLTAASQDHRLLPGVMVKYPQLADKLKHGWDVLSGEQQRNTLGQATEVYAALKSGRPDVAINLLKEQAQAMRNGGDEQGAKRLGDMALWAETDPQSMMDSTALRIAALPGGDKVIEGVGKLGAEGRAAAKAPAELRKAEAEATGAEAEAATKGVTAKYAERGALVDLQKKGWDIEAIKGDIAYKKESSRIAAMNAAISREGSDLKRQELSLKVQEAQQKLDDKVREKVATAEAGANSIDNMLNTVERIKTNKSLNDVLGSVEGRLPALVSDEANDAIALIDTLGSQAFLAQIPNIKGMGALSNAEGEKLQAALTNLSRKQSEKQFRANLDEASRLLKKGRESLARSTGVPLGKPDTPAAPGSRPPLDSFFAQ